MTRKNQNPEQETPTAGLQNEDARYRSLFESMSEGLAHHRMIFEAGQPVDYIFLEANSAFEKLTGLRNAVGKRVTEIIPGIRESQPEMFQAYGRVAMTGRPEKLEIYVVGLKAWFSVSAYSAERGCFTTVFENISDRKQAVEALRESEARLRTFLEASMVGLIISDQGVIVDVNPRTAQLLGYPISELAGRKVVDIIAPEDKALVQHHQTAGTESRASPICWRI
jgi:PAS domain S-box-containing protein